MSSQDRTPRSFQGRKITSSAIVLLFTGTMGIACFQNCSPVSFGSGTAASDTAAGGGAGGMGGTGGPICTIQNNTQPLRILFMVDDSGSTATTDTNYVERVQTVQTFLQNYGSNQSITYSYSYFHDNSETWNMSNSGYTSQPLTAFGNAAQAMAALTAFEATGPSGNTSYGSAFSQLSAIISNDEAAGDSEGYVVIFMSDGQPTDLGISGSQEINGITSLVNSLEATAGAGRLTISSVFFGSSSDTASIANLTTMAQLGGGVFVNTNTSTNLTIDNLINIPSKSCK